MTNNVITNQRCVLEAGFGSYNLTPSLEDVLKEVGAEVSSAENNWPAMNSAHEAYGVLMEEIRELEEHIFTNQKRRNMNEMRNEAIQVAAMAIRLVRDICDGNRGHK